MFPNFAANVEEKWRKCRQVLPSPLPKKKKGLTFLKHGCNFLLVPLFVLKERQQRGKGYKDLSGRQPRVKEKPGIAAIVLPAKALCQLIFQPII